MTTERLQNRTAWITGSSRGIGRVLAEHLASLGANVVIHGTSPTSTQAFNEAPSLEAVANEIQASTDAIVLSVWGDLSDEARVAELVGQVHHRFGQIDILVNCAGGDIGAQGAMGENAGKPVANDAVFISSQDTRAVLDRNLMTCLLVCQAVAPEMMERREGWIVNIGSIAGLAGRESGAIYGAAKAAVHAYTRALADQLRPYNVYANCVAPGPIITPRFVASRPIDESKQNSEGTLERYGVPMEIAKAVEFFVTSDSSYVTGQVLRVDGGGQLWPA